MGKKDDTNDKSKGSTKEVAEKKTDGKTAESSKPKAGTYQPVKRGLFKKLMNPALMFSQKSKNKYINDGYELLEEKDYRQAVIAFETAIVEEPKNIEAYVAIAKAYRQQEGIANAKLAVENLQKALAIDFKQLNLYLDLIKMYERLGDNKNAVLERKKAHIAKSLKNSADDPIANNNLGVIQLRQNHLDGAISSFEIAVKNKPTFWMAKTNLAKAYLQKSLTQKKKSEKKQLLESASTHLEQVLAKKVTAPALLIKAKIVFHHGNAKQALSICEQALKMDPAEKEIYATKMVIEEKLGNIVKAGQAFDDYHSIKESEKGKR